MERYRETWGAIASRLERTERNQNPEFDVAVPVDNAKAVLADPLVANLLEAARRSNWQPMTPAQLIALKILELIADKAPSDDPLRNVDVTRATGFNSGSVKRLLPLQEQRWHPLLRAVALGCVGPMTADAAAQLAQPDQIDEAIGEDDPDAAVQAVLDGIKADWKGKEGGSNLPGAS